MAAAAIATGLPAGAHVTARCLLAWFISSHMLRLNRGFRPAMQQLDERPAPFYILP